MTFWGLFNHSHLTFYVENEFQMKNDDDNLVKDIITNGRVSHILHEILVVFELHKTFFHRSFKFLKHTVSQKSNLCKQDYQDSKIMKVKTTLTCIII